MQSQRSINTLYKERGRVETSAIIENVSIDEDAARSAPNFRQKPKYLNSPPASLNEKVDNRYKVRMMENTACSAPTENVSEISGKHYERSSKHPRAWSPVRSVGSMVGTEAHPESDSTVFETDSSHGSCIFSEEDDQYGTQFWSESETTWTNCTAGAAWLEPSQLPNWFKDSVPTSDSCIDLNKEWRLKMIETLKQRLNGFDSSNYEKAVEMSSWVKSVEAKVAKNDTFEDCLLELEWLTTTVTGTGTLTVLNLDGVTTKMQLSLNDITCVMCCSEPGHPRLALYTPRLVESSPLKLQFANDGEMEDWLSHLTSVCCDLNDVKGIPADDSHWITTGLGDVFCFDPINLKAAQYRNDQKLFQKEINMLGAETPYTSPLPNGMPVGSILEITGCIFDDASQIRFDLQCHSTLRTRFIVEKMRHVACHLNPRFNEKLIVLNSMENSEWQSELRTDNMVFSPGAEFKLEIR